MPTTKTVKPFKFHKTVRWTEEVKWADQDHQLGVVEQVLNLIQPALSRALDIGVFHGVNPTGGAVVAAMTDKVVATTNSVEIGASDKPYANVDAADVLVLAAGYRPASIALDPVFAAKFGGLRNATRSRSCIPISRMRPPRWDASRACNVGVEHGGRGRYRSGSIQCAGVRRRLLLNPVGHQRNIGLEMIEFGDLDGGGDLKRNNQVAFRAEVVYGWGIADLLAFTKIIDAV